MNAFGAVLGFVIGLSFGYVAFVVRSGTSTPASPTFILGEHGDLQALEMMTKSSKGELMLIARPKMFYRDAYCRVIFEYESEGLTSKADADAATCQLAATEVRKRLDKAGLGGAK